MAVMTDMSSPVEALIDSDECQSSHKGGCSAWIGSTAYRGELAIHV